jgi:hypothetical protein
VIQSPNDKKELAEDLKAVKENTSPAVMLVDSGFFSRSAGLKIEAENPGLQVLAVIERHLTRAHDQAIGKAPRTRTAKSGHRLRHKDKMSALKNPSRREGASGSLPFFVE